MSDELPYDDSQQVEGLPESLVLDIGGEVGALILHADEACLGAEIDLTLAGLPRTHHVHTMIRRRRAPLREFVAGVYPALPRGTYTIWGLDGEPLGDVKICGGEVSEFHAGTCRAPKGGSMQPPLRMAQSV